MILLKMDAKDFVLSHYYYQSMMNFILNSSYLLIIFHLLDIPLGMGLCLSLFSFFSKTIGEVIHIRYYQKNHVKLLTESLYFFMIILGLGISFLPFFHLYFYPQVIFVMTLIFGFFALYGIYYLHHVKDYPIIYKRLNTYQMVVNQENENAYTRQLMVNIQEKDVHISEKKLKGKKGYDLFNTIFFERHKGILLRSAKLFAITSGILIFITAIVIFEFPSYAPYINQQLTKNLSWVIFILYFINRGAVITQAMFFNCDHAMLTFNFYREPRVILELFKKRLKMLIRINLIPTLVIGIGLVFLLYLSSGKFLLDYVMIFVLILAMSIFFSVHYLVIYYLLQPYSKEMQMKDFRYSIVQLFTYLGCYLFTGLSINMNLFCLLGILFMISYIAISLRLVYKKAPTTFKIQ